MKFNIRKLKKLFYRHQIDSLWIEYTQVLENFAPVIPSYHYLLNVDFISKEMLEQTRKLQNEQWLN